MSDLPQRSEENEERFLEEIEEGVVISNMELLRMRLVSTHPNDPQDEKTKLALFGIRDQGTQLIEGGMQHSITITYNTRTGEISYASGTYLGDFSIIRTDLIEKGDTKIILLYRKGDMPAAWEYDEAISGIRTGPETGTRRIMPERLSPEHPTLRGINEVWGESQFVDSAKGDLVILKTIRKFNETYGPPK